MWWRKSFMRSFLYIMAFFIALMVCFGTVIYKHTAETVKAQLASKCVGIASAVAVLIEQDIDGFRSFCETLDTDSAYYQRTKANLETVRYANEGSIAFLYTEIRVSDTDMMYVIDGESPHAPLYSAPGLVDALTASEMEAYARQATYIPDAFVTNDYGTLLTCYVPIVDQGTGAFVGLVGADVSKDQYTAIMRNQLMLLGASISLLVIMVAVMLVLSSNRVERMVTIDALTGVYTKPYFLTSLRYHLHSMPAKDEAKATYVLMADLDHFKQVNDRYGHPFGDVVLQAVAKAMGTSLRKTDCIARYGGEEFAGYLPDIDKASARMVIERIRENVAAILLHNEAFGEMVSLTISIGVSRATERDAATDAVQRADKALYFAKRTRNTATFYEDVEDEMT